MMWKDGIKGSALNFKGIARSYPRAAQWIWAFVWALGLGACGADTQILLETPNEVLAQTGRLTVAAVASAADPEMLRSVRCIQGIVSVHPKSLVQFLDFDAQNFDPQSFDPRNPDGNDGGMAMAFEGVAPGTHQVALFAVENSCDMQREQPGNLSTTVAIGRLDIEVGHGLVHAASVALHKIPTLDDSYALPSQIIVESLSIAQNSADISEGFTATVNAHSRLYADRFNFAWSSTCEGVFVAPADAGNVGVDKLASVLWLPEPSEEAQALSPPQERCEVSVQISALRDYYSDDTSDAREVSNQITTSVDVVYAHTVSLVIDPKPIPVPQFIRAEHRSSEAEDLTMFMCSSETVDDPFAEFLSCGPWPASLDDELDDENVMWTTSVFAAFEKVHHPEVRIDLAAECFAGERDEQGDAIAKYSVLSGRSDEPDSETAGTMVIDYNRDEHTVAIEVTQLETIFNDTEGLIGTCNILVSLYPDYPFAQLQAPMHLGMQIVFDD